MVILLLVWLPLEATVLTTTNAEGRDAWLSSTLIAVVNDRVDAPACLHGQRQFGPPISPTFELPAIHHSDMPVLIVVSERQPGAAARYVLAGERLRALPG
jgi:hypothetical protein